MTAPLCIDLFCGLGGWTDGFLAEGYEVIGFDIEQHIYGDARYPAQLVVQDVCTLHGSQFRNADVIVASSPCQEFSYRAMPWKRAKALGPPELGMHLFSQARRIQLEAIEAAGGRFIPMIQENVRGAQPWVGRAPWHYGSYYLWGDVPALMPVPKSRRFKSNTGTHARLEGPGRPRLISEIDIDEEAGTKGYAARLGESTISRRHGSKSKARKMASAKIAKIPFPLASHIARVYRPQAVAA